MKLFLLCLLLIAFINANLAAQTLRRLDDYTMTQLTTW